MKTYIRLIMIISLLFNCSNCLWARQNSLDSIRFSGNLSDKLTGKVNGSVYINYDPDDWFFYAGNTKHLSQKTDTNGKFSFSLPDFKKPYKINVLIRNDEKKKLWSGSFYVDSHDNVKMHLLLDSSKRTISFDGNGNENYNLLLRIDKQYWEEYRSKLALLKINSFRNLQELDNKIERLSSLLKVFIEAKRKQIDRSSINNQMKAILNDEFAWYQNDWNFILFSLHQSYPLYRTHIYKKYLEKNLEFDHPITTSSVFCPTYMGMASNRIARESIMANNGNKTDIVTQYSIVREKYSGVIRDRMIGQCFFSSVTLSNFKSSSYAVMDSLLADAEKIVTNTPIRSAISVKRQTLAKINQKKIINASFLGLDGKIFDLKSLDGKVILIEIWFNGCIGCANFHNNFEKEVFPKFKQNPKFVVLGLNVDKKKKDWQKGIASSRYSSHEYVNVNTGEGIGFEHPFTKYYNIQGSPTLMLIDSAGNIIYQPPLGLYSITEITTKIQQALDKLVKGI